MPKERTGTVVCISCTKEWYASIRETAGTLDMNLSAFVRSVVQEAISRGVAHEFAIAGFDKIGSSRGMRKRRYIPSLEWKLVSKGEWKSGDFHLLQRGRLAARGRQPGIDGWWLTGPGLSTDGVWLATAREEAQREAVAILDQHR